MFPLFLWHNLTAIFGFYNFIISCTRDSQWFLWRGVSPRVTTIPSGDPGHALLPPKSSAPPCVTSAYHAKPCARHMHRSLLSLNSRLGQPFERRQAHRLCHQSRWTDHSENIESFSWVNSVVCCGSNFQLLGAEILHNIANLFNSEAVLKCDQNDCKTVWVYVWYIIINNLVAAEKKGTERNSWCKLNMKGMTWPKWTYYTLKFIMIEEVSLFVTKAIMLSSE